MSYVRRSAALSGVRRRGRALGFIAEDDSFGFDSFDGRGGDFSFDTGGAVSSPVSIDPVIYDAPQFQPPPVDQAPSDPEPYYQPTPIVEQAPSIPPMVVAQVPLLDPSTVSDASLVSSADAPILVSSPQEPAPSGYPRTFNPAEWPGVVIAGNNGQVLGPDDVWVVLDQMGVERVVPRAKVGVPDVITVAKPDLIEWRAWPGTGGLVEQKFVNGVATNEGRPWKPFEQMTEAEKRAYWFAQDPGSIATGFITGPTDYRGNSVLTDSVKETIAILNAAGATTAAQAASAAAGTTVSNATAGVQVTPPATGTRPSTEVKPAVIYTATTTPTTTGTPAASGSHSSEPVVTVVPGTSSSKRALLWIGAGILGLMLLGGRRGF